MSVDGKISTGDTSERDVDKDFKKIEGVKEGLHQYYDIEKTTDAFSLNSGIVMSKIGVNTPQNPIHCPDISFIIIDNNNLNEDGVNNLCNNLKNLYLVTTNKSHPAYKTSNKNLTIISYDDEVNFKDLFERLHNEYGADRVTIQSGGTLNSKFIREGLVDIVSVVVAPCLIGGKDTSTLVDGKSFRLEEELKNVKSLKLIAVNKLDDNYLHLVYSVNN